MAVRKQSMASAAEADLRDGAGRAAEHAWRSGAARHSPAQRQQLQAAIRAARREHLRRSLEAVVQMAVWMCCLILLTAVVIHAAQPPGADALAQWISPLAEPLVRPFAGLLPEAEVLGAEIQTNALLAIAVIWLVGRGVISALRLLLGEQSSDAWPSESPFGGSRS